MTNKNGQEPSGAVLRTRLVRLLRKYGRDEVISVINEVTNEIPPDDVIKSGGISIRAAAREYGVPVDFLWRWANSGHIPILYKGKGQGTPTYLDRKAVQRAAEIYQKAKSEGIQPIRLLQRPILT